METKHTPGPWRVGCPSGKRHYVMVGGHTVIAELPNAQEDSAGVIDKYRARDANARLIAAAIRELNATMKERKP
mgnify:CR=1 FL=1